MLVITCSVHDRVYYSVSLCWGFLDISLNGVHIGMGVDQVTSSTGFMYISLIIACLKCLVGRRASRLANHADLEIGW